MTHQSPFLRILLLVSAIHLTTTHAEVVYIGDAAGDEANVIDGTAGPDGSGVPAPGAITYAFYASGYTNDSGAVQLIQILNANFWGRNAGIIVTPFVAVYNGGADPGNGSIGGNYDVLARGDGIISEVGLNNAPFLNGAGNPFINLDNGDTLIAGFHQEGQVVPWIDADGSVGDYLDEGIEIPEVPPGGALIENAEWSSLARGYRFNIGIETEAVPPTDSDSDGLPDAWETENELNPNDPDDADDDPDGDTLTNLDEYANQTDPNEADTDGDTLRDDAELAGSGSRPPTNPTRADTDGDGLSDLAETNTGVYVSETDTGSDPTDDDSDDDTLGDGEEVNGVIFSNPNLADTDGDGFDDAEELSRGTDPNNAADFPMPNLDAIYIGDAASEGADVTDGNAGPDTAGEPGPGAITYGFYETGYTNDTAGSQVFQIMEVNFWGRNAGVVVTPFVAVYNGGADSANGSIGTNYNVLSRGDGITSEAGLNNAGFLVAGEIPEVTLESGDTLIGGFHQEGQVVPWIDGDGSVGDYLDEGIEIPDVPPGGALTEGAEWSNLARGYRFNIGLALGSSSPFAITAITFDEEANEASITFPSRAGQIFAVESSTDLSIWFELDDGVQGQEDATTFVDETIPPPPAARRRFYRVIKQ